MQFLFGHVIQDVQRMSKDGKRYGKSINRRENEDSSISLVGLNYKHFFEHKGSNRPVTHDLSGHTADRLVKTLFK